MAGVGDQRQSQAGNVAARMLDFIQSRVKTMRFQLPEQLMFMGISGNLKMTAGWESRPKTSLSEPEILHSSRYSSVIRSFLVKSMSNDLYRRSDLAFTPFRAILNEDEFRALRCATRDVPLPPAGALRSRLEIVARLGRGDGRRALVSRPKSKSCCFRPSCCQTCS
jgi:hypothetical protein